MNYNPQIIGQGFNNINIMGGFGAGGANAAANQNPDEEVEENGGVVGQGNAVDGVEVIGDAVNNGNNAAAQGEEIVVLLIYIRS